MIEESVNNGTNKIHKLDVFKETKSSVFIRPMLKYSIPFWFESGYINTYIGLKPETIYIVFDRTLEYSVEFKKVSKTLEENYLYIDTLYYEKFVVLRLQVPVEFIEDFYTFLDGGYSRLSEEYKQNLLMLYIKFNKLIYQRINTTLYPTKKDIEAKEFELGAKLYVKELVSSPDLHKELFNEDNFI
jgi:hypothetical protein